MLTLHTRSFGVPIFWGQLNGTDGRKAEEESGENLHVQGL
jgi:hypothetical protein